MKFLLFLDLDGVLMHEGHPILSKNHLYTEFDPQAVGYLKKLLEQEDIRIIVSSSLRVGYSIEDLKYTFFRHYGLDSYIDDVTPCLWGKIRGAEISHFLRNTTIPYDDYIVIDDNDDMGDHMGRLIQTNTDTGFNESAYKNTLEKIRRLKRHHTNKVIQGSTLN